MELKKLNVINSQLLIFNPRGVKLTSLPMLIWPSSPVVLETHLLHMGIQILGWNSVLNSFLYVDHCVVLCHST